MDLHQFIYGAYPYLAGTIFLLGSLLRFEREQYTWKSDSSQLLSKKYMRLASNWFHVGIIMIFFGHLGGMLTPESWFHAMGVSDLTHQYVAIYAGLVFGTMCLIGATILLLRRLLNRRVRAVSRFMDIFILAWLLTTLCLGLSTIPTSWHHAQQGDPSVMLALASWVKSVATLSVDPSLIRGVDTIYKVHLFFGMTVFLLFPFTRLVHIWSVPLSYITRAYQVVRVKQVAAR
ncbi:MAG: respiratory nitrate reductase subunit gamma [Gammaproteobacteria bacterium]|nr:respiratory nitrate reductase subunit gamma [Gammaproteobacteria bacterium]